MKLRILDVFYPPRCPFCRRKLEAEAICPDCQEGLPWLTDAAARRKLENVKLCASALRYEGLAKACVRRCKFRRQQGYARILGPLTAQCAHDHLPQDFDLISWPPLSPRSLRRRGFDQSQLLAQAVALDRGLEATPLFKKRNFTGQQSRIRGYAQRKANVLGAYSLLDPEAVAGKRVLLVDDVVTTGATLSECARVLLTAGAREVFAVTLTSARWGRRDALA